MTFHSNSCVKNNFIGYAFAGHIYVGWGPHLAVGPPVGQPSCTALIISPFPSFVNVYAQLIFKLSDSFIKLFKFLNVIMCKLVIWLLCYFRLYSEDRNLFNQMAREWTWKYAMTEIPQVYFGHVDLERGFSPLTVRSA